MYTNYVVDEIKWIFEHCQPWEVKVTFSDLKWMLQMKQILHELLARPFSFSVLECSGRLKQSLCHLATWLVSGVFKSKMSHKSNNFHL